MSDDLIDRLQWCADRGGHLDAPLEEAIAEIKRLRDENKGLRWLVSEYEAALTIIKRRDIIEGIRSDFLK